MFKALISSETCLISLQFGRLSSNCLYFLTIKYNLNIYDAHFVFVKSIRYKITLKYICLIVLKVLMTGKDIGQSGLNLDNMKSISENIQ